MSLEDNKTLVRRFYEAISFDGDLAVLDELCVPEYVHCVSPTAPRDLAWLKATVLRMRAGFPDWRYTVDELLAEGDQIWALWTGQGTHLGEWEGTSLTQLSLRPPVESK